MGLKKWFFLLYNRDVIDIFENNFLTTWFQPIISLTDMEIIRGIDKDPVKQSIFGALSTIAHENGIKVLAEGVETCEECAYVKQHGADLSQGYLFGKPTAEPVRRVVYCT
jgi:EAL domain-containing protein (putative c-di-GMP-specific phosphodiesterase class I)